MKAALAIACLLMTTLTTTPATAETLIAALSTDKIAITSNFSGGTVVVFGVIERDGASATRTESYNVVVTVRGPRGAVTVREKERWGPFWVNRESHKYIATPAFLAILSNRPLDQIASPEMRQKFLIGVDTLVTAQADRAKVADPDEPAFRSALIRIRSRQQLFRETPEGVKFLTPTVFKAVARIPGIVPLGAYSVEVVVFADGLQIAKTTMPFIVTKSGAEEEIASLAHSMPLLYGLSTAAMALFCGWIASLIFRRD